MIKGLNLNDFNFRWNEEKNKKLQNERGVSFEEIVSILKNDKIIDIVENPSANFDNQECYIIEIKSYIWVIPYVKDGNEIFLKTAFPSRKHTKIYFNN